MADQVFICYAREDQEFVLELAKNLKDMGVPVWVDQWDIPPGVNWNRAIDNALYECAQFLIVLSPAAVESERVEGEWVTAVEEKKAVIPVLYKGCRIPTRLKLFQHVDLTSRGPDDSGALDQILRVLKVAKPEPGKKEAAPPKPKEKPLEKEITNSIEMKFVLIPAGTFNMGSRMSPEEVVEKYGGSAEYYKGEYPQHKVVISKPVYLQATEVTQGQWKSVMRNNPSKFKDCGDEYPIENVSWNGVQKFLEKLNQMENTDKYRLPTEAEWEYACRAGSNTAFCFGDNADELGDYAWYKANSANKTHPVGQKKPNAFGLYDMHGNVQEWCQDRHGAYPAGDVEDPKGPSTGIGRVLRGGSFTTSQESLRCSYRNWFYPVYWLKGFGFRVALSP